MAFHWRHGVHVNRTEGGDVLVSIPVCESCGVDGAQGVML